MRDISEIAEPPELTDGRVRLRPWQAGDAAACAAMCDDPDVARFIPVPSPYTLADGEEWVGDALRKWREDRWAQFAVLDATGGGPVASGGRAAGGRLIASCGLKIDAERATGEIGYLVHRDERRRGIASACIRLLTRWAFDDLGLQRLQIRADVRNAASRRTVTAAGFRLEGVLRDNDVIRGARVDDALYSLLPGDRRPADDAGDGGGGVGGDASGDVGGGASGGDAPPSLGWPRLPDGRLVVRPFEPDDAPAVRAACDDPDVAHWIHLLPAPYTQADAEWFVADARHRLLVGDRARLAICDATTDELLGSVSLDLFAGRQAGEIGYWIKREARRSGVALAAARLVVGWAFGPLGLERLELMTYPGNEASQALAAKLGFTREALLRGFLAPEPDKSRDGRVVPSADGSLPPRDDQVQFALLRSDRPPSA